MIGKIRYDNLKAAVASGSLFSRQGRGCRTAVRSYYGIEAFGYSLESKAQKGGVEGQIG